MTLLTLAVATLLLGGAPEKPTTPNSVVRKVSRVQLASDGWKLATARYQAGSAPFEEVVRWSQWLFDAELAADGDPARARHLARLRELEHQVEGRVQQGVATRGDLLSVQYLIATAE